MSLPNINFLYLKVSDIYSQEKILKPKFITSRYKVKSRSHHDTAHLQPLTNVPTKYILQFLGYSPDKILKISVTTIKSKVKSQRRCTPTPPNQCSYSVSTSYTLWFPRYSPYKILKVKVTTARSKVKSRSQHDTAQLQPLTNVPTKY